MSKPGVQIGNGNYGQYTLGGTLALELGLTVYLYVMCHNEKTSHAFIFAVYPYFTPWLSNQVLDYQYTRLS